MKDGQATTGRWLPHGSDGRAMGGTGPAGGATGGTGTAPNSEPAGGTQRAVVSGPRRVSLAAAPARVSALDGGALLLRQVDPRRDLGRSESPPRRAGARAAGAPPAAHRGDYRQPERQDDRGRRGAGLGWGKKRGAGASGTIWWRPGAISAWAWWARGRRGDGGGPAGAPPRGAK